MQRAEIKRLAEADFTASLVPLPAPLIVVDETEIPESFWRPQPPKLDRKALIAALSGGLLCAARRWETGAPPCRRGLANAIYRSAVEA